MTPRIRSELQATKETSAALAAAYGLNPKTVARWRRRGETADAPTGLKAATSMVLIPAEEAIVVEFAADRGRQSRPAAQISGRKTGKNPGKNRCRFGVNSLWEISFGADSLHPLQSLQAHRG